MAYIVDTTLQMKYTNTPNFRTCLIMAKIDKINGNAAKCIRTRRGPLFTERQLSSWEVKLSTRYIFCRTLYYQSAFYNENVACGWVITLMMQDILFTR